MLFFNFFMNNFWIRFFPLFPMKTGASGHLSEVTVESDIQQQHSKRSNKCQFVARANSIKFAKLVKKINLAFLMNRLTSCVISVTQRPLLQIVL